MVGFSGEFVLGFPRVGKLIDFIEIAGAIDFLKALR